MKGTIIYLHGFASSGNSKKSQALKDHFGQDRVHAPNLPTDPDQVISVIHTIVSGVLDYPLIFVGTSLGGFWANYFAQKYDAMAVLVNPSVNPDHTMKARIGATLVNFSTGEPMVITQDHVSKFAQCKLEAAELYNGNLVHVFLAKDDDTINYTVALKDLKYFKSCTITEDGGHRYDNKWSTVIEKIDEILNNQ
jgi:uncharacterized protein